MDSPLAFYVELLRISLRYRVFLLADNLQAFWGRGGGTKVLKTFVHVVARSR